MTAPIGTKAQQTALRNIVAMLTIADSGVNDARRIARYIDSMNNDDELKWRSASRSACCTQPSKTEQQWVGTRSRTTCRPLNVASGKAYSRERETAGPTLGGPAVSQPAH